MERCWFSSAARKKGNFPTVFFHFAGEHDLCRPQESFSFVIVHTIEFNIVFLAVVGHLTGRGINTFNSHDSIAG